MLRRHSAIALAGTIHFVTTVTRIRGQWFTEPRLCTSILRAFERSRAKTKLNCLGFVLMPDHFHVLLHQPDDGPWVPRCIAGFKKSSPYWFSIPEFHGVRLWRDGYDDVLVPGSAAVYTKLNYLHHNPVRRGLIQEPEKYPWSSAGLYYDERENGVVTVVKFS